jgi:peptidoglycan hydrolase-like protein with peptidoglycan-binding domain
MSAPISDVAAHARWHESLSASRERRAAAGRRRRRRFRARSLLIAAALSMLVLSAGVALAASTGGSSSSSESQTLQLGSRGSAVKQLQRKLRVSPVSGYFGNETRGAVKRFQKRRGLTADGVAGPATLRALGIRVTKSSYATGGSAPSSGSQASQGSSGGSNVKLPPALKRIAQCESGGNPRAISRSGRYRGKFQFDQPTWESAGGTGDPAAASESTQDRIALKLYRKRGTAPWPNCAS